MSIGEHIYRAAARAAPTALRLVAPFSGKVRRGLEGRAESIGSLLEWSVTHRDRSRPLLWLHAPSVGEALMAQAILAEVRQQRPDVQTAFTFFSPSAERVAARVGADWAGYLPWDIRRHMAAALDVLDIACVAFVRTEIWPVLVAEAQRRGARAVLLNAVLSAGSSRTGAGARMLLGPAYRQLDAVGAVSRGDADRFAVLGVSPERVHLTGDARFDQVWQRVRSLDRSAPLLQQIAASAGPWLVAGSTWPGDEECLVPVLADAARAGRGWRTIIAPHEPDAVHLAGLERRLDRHGLSHARLPELHSADLPPTDLLVVDRVGVLADLYAAADAAWVGGGFGSAGLHSVVEPAALGVPVAFGPRHGNAQEAGRLVDAGGGFIVRDAAALGELLRALHPAGDYRNRAGAAARSFVAEHVGGARRNAQLILDRLPQA